MNTPDSYQYLNVGDSPDEVRDSARKDMPAWLVSALDQDLDTIWKAFEAEYTGVYSKEFSRKIQSEVRRSESNIAHSELPEALANRLQQPVPAEIPNGARLYFETFLAHVHEQIIALTSETTIPDWLSEALDKNDWDLKNVSIDVSEYFTRFSDALKKRIETMENDHPHWLDELLQAQAEPAIPNGASAYFAGFSDQVKDTIHRIEVLEELEAREPDTIERLVESPDWFDLTLQDDSYLSLPVGKELFFDDFSERVRSQVAARNLDQPANGSRLYVLRKRASWAAAACFGFLMGFLASYI